MAIDLYNLLERHYPGVKWTIDSGTGDDFKCGWTEQLGFKVDYNPVLKKTKLTAPKQIQDLKQFVEADVNVTPRMPASDAVNKIEAMPLLQPDDVGYDQQQRDNQWMWEILGHIQHICKVRMECKTATNQCARHSHAPCPLAIKCVNPYKARDVPQYMST